jgi:catechol-2,3-dioxygenase
LVGRFAGRAGNIVIESVNVTTDYKRRVEWLPLQSCAIGFSHVALEVGDIEEALGFYGSIFDFQLRGKSKTTAFIDLGDEFIALQAGRKQPADAGRHVGLVVDDKEAARALTQLTKNERAKKELAVS